MKDDAGDRRGRFGWALPVSLGLHLLIAAVLLLELPIALPEPQEDQAIAVDLVPPPEETQPEPPPPAPEPEKPDAAQPETPPANTDAAAREALPVLNPVFEFGQKDAGPREALDGNSGEAGVEKPPSDPLDQAAAETPPETPVEAEERITPAEPEEPVPPADAEQQGPPAEASDSTVSEPASTESDPAEAADGDGVDGASALPETLQSPDAQASAGQPAAPVTETEAEAEVQVLLPATARAPAPRPAGPARAPSAPGLQEAKRLFSRSSTGDAAATTAMGGLPREARGGRLCVTELREQLRNASPPYFPDLLPSYPLNGGTVLDVADAAFRMRGQWYNLGFRCTVDAEATKVVSFAFRVGAPIPRSEWVRRELPSH